MLFARRRFILKPHFALLVAVLTATSSSFAAETHRLEVVWRENQAREVVTLLEARGELKLRGREKKVQRLPLEVRGDSKYTERLLDPARSIRLYEKASAKIKIGDGGAKPKLRGNRRLVLAQNSDQLRYRAAQGPIRREELDLLRTQGDSLAIAGLLPGEPVEVGATWNADAAAWAKVLALESVTEAAVEFRLASVEGNIALVSFEGDIDGAVGGVSTEIRVRGKLNVNTELQEITWLAMTMKENRSIGVAEPGVEASSRLRVAINHVPSMPELSAQAIAGMPQTIEDEAAILEFESQEIGFRLIYEPAWRLMIQRPNFAIFRLVQDGELIAQANVSRLASRPLDKPFKMVEFQRDIQTSLDKNFAQFVETAEFTTDAGANVLRVTASGQVEDVPIQWIYYHLTSDRGERLTLSFTMAAQQAERFGGADRTLVNSVEVLPLPEPQAASGESSGSGSSQSR